MELDSIARDSTPAVMERVHFCKKTGLKKGTWSPQEDLKLIAYINKYRIWNWNEMSKAAGLSRSGKSCRLRWMNYLRPDVKRGNFSMEEVETIKKLHKARGNKWSEIAANLPGRTDNEIKNFWHTHLKKHYSKNPIPHKVKEPKHDKNKVAGLNTPLANESNLESSICFAISPQLSIGDFSSSSKDSTDEIGENETGKKKNTYSSPGTADQELNGMEELFIGEDNPMEMGEPGFTSPFHQVGFEEYSYGLGNDELTGFWFDLFLFAQQLQV
ncbi:hypothetical protein F0562_034665 [Nyssa sinensis]|uniref:Uncharacterized protein n=1 Tax=Nyssa sinensis TaxID=561372 RepID=A0A5J5AB14_9ASTE|nr:hypothetical protein F0562_034665 [Nyssa sinensis]